MAFRNLAHHIETRLVEFRRPDKFPPNRGGPETFDMLGFTHYWDKSRSNKWIIKRKTAKDRFRRALKRVAQWCREHRHDTIEQQQKALRMKLQVRCRGGASLTHTFLVQRTRESKSRMRQSRTSG
jgi:hypothetical protein